MSKPMTVRKLIAALIKVNMNAVVEAYDPELEAWEPVTGMVYDQTSVQLYTDIA